MVGRSGAGGCVGGAGGGAAVSGAGSSPHVSIATRAKILQRCSSGAFTRYSMTSASMITGRVMAETAGYAAGFGRIGTTTSWFVGAGGTGLSERGGVMCGIAMPWRQSSLRSQHAGWSAP